MITIFKKDGSTEEQQEIELRGLSTDEKPTKVDNEDIPNGTAFIEMDTGKIYMYDLENEQWKEL